MCGEFIVEDEQYTLHYYELLVETVRKTVRFNNFLKLSHFSTHKSDERNCFSTFFVSFKQEQT